MTLRIALMVSVLAAGCGKRSDPEPAAEPEQPPAAPADPLLALRWDDAPIDWSRPVPETPPGGLAEKGYVGARACRPCHREIYDSYAGHPMARSGLRRLADLDQRWLARIFDAGAGQAISHSRSGYAYRPFRRGSRYFVEETLVDAAGAPVQRWEQEVTHALSAGDYGLALYFAQGSRFWHAPIDYFGRAGRWDLDPFAAGGNPRFFSPLGPFCISCHSDYPRRRAGAERSFLEPTPSGVTCERCHGPGARHADTTEAADVINPEHLPPLRQLEVCTRCHLEAGSIARAGRHEFSFRPGEPLGDFRVEFLADPGQPDRVELLAHPERLVRSACWQKSKGALTCTTCHDPHRRAADQPPGSWDAACRSCHDQRPCSEQAAVRAASGDHCVGCHMRTAPAARVALVNITDHWIQRRPPPIRPGREPPTALETWAELVGEPSSGGDLAAVEAAGYEHAGMHERALELAVTAAPGRPDIPELYAILAGGLRQRGRPDRAARAEAAVLRFAPDDHDALMGYALALLDAGGAASAEEAGRALDRLLALDPEDPRALEVAGMLRFRGGRTEEARVLFERAVAAGPASVSARVGLAVIARRAGQHDRAAAELEAASRIEPADAWILDQLAAERMATGDRDGAAAVADLRARLTAMGRTPGATAASAWLPPDWR